MSTTFIYNFSGEYKKLLDIFIWLENHKIEYQFDKSINDLIDMVLFVELDDYAMVNITFNNEKDFLQFKLVWQ